MGAVSNVGGTRVPAWQRTLEFSYFASIAVAVIPYGSVHPLPQSISSSLTCFVYLLSLGKPLTNPVLVRMNLRACMLALGLACYIILQGIQGVTFLPVHSAWSLVESNFAKVPGAISVNPTATMWSIVDAISPFLSFMACLTIFSSDSSALRLWTFIRGFGVLIASLALVQFFFLPGTLLLSEKWTYQDSLTATFVNRNTAATFLGIILIVCCASLMNAIRKIKVEFRIGSRIPEFIGSYEVWRPVYMLMAGVLVVSLALFFTMSRGGFFGALSSLILLNVLMYFRNRKVRNLLIQNLIVIGVSITLFLFFIFFGGLTLQRVQIGGYDEGRACAYASILRAVFDNMLYGSGLGSFSDVFPIYRNPACAGVDGIWDRAHNGYLEGALGLGLTYVFLLIYILFVINKQLWIGLLVRDRLRYVIAAVFGWQCLLLMHTVVDFSIQIPGVAALSAAVLGIGVVVSARGRHVHNAALN